MNIRVFIFALVASIVSAMSAQAALVTASTPVTFVFDTSALGDSFAINSGGFDCTSSCPAGPNIDAPEALADGASMGFDFGSTAGGDDFGARSFTNNFGMSVTNASGGIFGGGTIVVSGPLALLYVTVFFVDDEFGIDYLAINIVGGGQIVGELLDGLPDVPLPAALPLFLAGLAGLGLRSRKKAA